MEKVEKIFQQIGLSEFEHFKPLKKLSEKTGLKHCESPTPNPDEDKQWLFYWVLYGMIMISDVLFGFLLYKIPIYDLFKLIFIIWLFHPRLQGAAKVYDKAFKTIIEKYEQINENNEKNEEENENEKEKVIKIIKSLGKLTKDKKDS